MNNTPTEIIVYRSPYEKAQWDSYNIIVDFWGNHFMAVNICIGILIVGIVFMAVRDRKSRW